MGDAALNTTKRELATARLEIQTHWTDAAANEWRAGLHTSELLPTPRAPGDGCHVHIAATTTLQGYRRR